MKKLFSKAPILLLAMLLTILGTALTPGVVSADPPWIMPSAYTYSSSNSFDR